MCPRFCGEYYYYLLVLLLFCIRHETVWRLPRDRFQMMKLSLAIWQHLLRGSPHS